MPNLLNYIPAAVWSAIPVLDIGDHMGVTNYIDFIDPVEMGDNGVMRGRDMYGRPFICIRVEVAYKADKIRKTSWVFQTFFQRYTEDSDMWMGAGHYVTSLLNSNGGLTEKQCILLAKLIGGFRMRIIRTDWELYRFPYELTKGSEERNSDGNLVIENSDKCLEMELLM